MRYIERTLLTAALSASLAVVSATTRAETPNPFNPSVVVRYADLNLSSPEGTRILYARIRKAAQTVCGTRFSVWDHRRLQAWKDCYRATVDDAVNRIDTPMLTSLHQRQSKAAPG